jgi:hypothetical protein
VNKRMLGSGICGSVFRSIDLDIDSLYFAFALQPSYLACQSADFNVKLKALTPEKAISYL